ncbi:MAG: parvulin-like peptidyl-prolyl isomerase [Planctomycetota bacterium]|jgi:parvulin-like peptidyl-prolyl isomerase
MLIATLCLQASLLVHPMYLEEERPETRSVQHILVLHDDLEGQPFKHGKGHDETLVLMESLLKRIDAGENFGDLAREYSAARTSASFGSLGTFPKGTLREPFDEFLFTAELGEVSQILDLPSGMHLVKRVEPWAAVLQIQLKGSGDESRVLAREIVVKLDDGADFSELVKKYSVDADSAARGGAYHVFERGSNDALVKLAAFRTPLGQVSPIVETPFGLHILKRVKPETLAPELWDDNFMRVRGILIAHLKAEFVDKSINRTQSEAKQQGDEVAKRVTAGEPFEEIAARFNDDPGGKERAGDLGWIHRQNPDLPHFFSKLFAAKSGTLSDVYLTSFGVVVLIRE